METFGREPARTVDDARARVLAVDDHVPFLALLRDVIGSTGHLELVGEAQSGEAAVAAARELHPDMVLMDVHMPGLGGLAAAERIKADSPATLVVLISTTHPDELVPLGRRRRHHLEEPARAAAARRDLAEAHSPGLTASRQASDGRQERLCVGRPCTVKYVRVVTGRFACRHPCPAARADVRVT
jgi:CheY-like chemotaxis protein